MTTPAAVAWDLSPGKKLIIDSAEWTVETFEPQVGKVVLVRADGPAWHTSVRRLMYHHHPTCRPSTRTRKDLPAASRGRQQKAMPGLTPERQQLTLLRLAHLNEVETGYRSGDPLLAAPGEPRPQYDPDTTTSTQRRQAKAEELRLAAAENPE
ncbi:hypothetical protein [Streptomyces sp. NPDC001410]|uniref:hypothetical protein n=1 Tax=Streptomyces sp. NPDC001410 TaxID=3364574 RepID=UPI0036843BCF